ncbi:hypothetical protein B0H67DRAFT_519590 [Lasiosphaeris hirsuta]|uniref:Leucine-rich repeat-containing protein 40 n=1 Tax=Lasiosphaeris hirsuta TaxID=260670 RepID=A0AA40DL43_9PEZI|nr:hypothetical protein B0H67DRAFT_519590 [Lasiosphaeris hirsuta]
MDEPRQGRLTGIPRLSKLPAPSSKLPIPRSSSIRASPSRESLATAGATSTGGTLRNPKLRPAPSRDQLLPTTASSRSQPAAPSRAVSSPQHRASLAQAPGIAARTSRYSPNISQPQRPGRTDGRQPTPQGGRPSSVVHTLPRRQPSQQWISASTNFSQEDEAPSSLGTPVKPSSDEASSESARTSSARPRPSLTERTMETLLQLPSSPSIRGKVGAASFFESTQAAMGPPSRPVSRSSRPGSSHRSDGSSRCPSRTGSRPGSSSGLDQSVSNFRSSIGIYQNPLSAIESTPLRGRRSIQPLQTPSAQSTPGRTARSPAHGFQPALAASMLRSRTPSPEKRAPEVPVSRFGARTLAARPTKRPSINGLFRKPSMQALDKSSSVAEMPRKVSSASRGSSATSGEGTNPSSASIASASTAITADSVDTTPQSSKKSSAALREQIAKAKAAKRAASQQASSSAPLFEAPEPPLIPTDNTFDFGLANDPFNQRRDDQSQTKMLKGRLETARTSGRLNIAAMGLREIPADVMNMYNFESGGKAGAVWAESVDLTRFVAADNELEMISDSVFPDVDLRDFADDEDSQGNIFAGLETLDLHGNMLIALPMGLRRLPLLTSLNLSQNRLANNCLEVVSQISALRDLKLGGNLLYGPLDPCFASLENLEILDLHGNNIASLPSNFGNLTRLRVLNISENAFETLPFEIFATLPLTELNARKNQLRGTLIQESVESLPSLRNLDVSANQLSHLCAPGERAVAMPAIQQICVSMNRLQSLPDVSTWTNLLTLAADENSINAIPEGFTSLQQLRSVDLSSNDIRVVPSEIGRMESLTMIRLSGNPLREKKFSSINTDELKAILALRLEPPPAHLEAVVEPPTPVAGTHDSEVRGSQASPPSGTGLKPGDPVDVTEDMDDSRSDLDDFATPPTSIPGSPARSRSHTLSNQMWPVKPGGVLDRSGTQSSSLHPVVCSKIVSNHKVYEVQLHHNLFTALPESLTFFAETMTALSLAHNQLVGEMYMGGPEGNAGLDLPALKELNLAGNHITGLGPLLAHLRAPKLQKLDVSFNRITSLPPNGQIREVFPSLTVLLMSNNHLADLDPEAIKGLRVVDAGNNDIAHLNPRIGLLGGTGGLERLEVGGNRFRVPRFNVLDRGTEATLRWLRGRVPVAEMGAWKGDDGDEGETSMADLD